QLVAFDLAHDASSIGKKAYKASSLAFGPIAVISASIDENDRLYSYSYIGDSISLLRSEPEGFSNLSSKALYNPELGSIQRGRRYLYDATATSGNNRVSCASCHIF